MNRVLLWVTSAVGVLTLHAPIAQADTQSRPAVVVEDASLAEVNSEVKAGCARKGWSVVEDRPGLVTCRTRLAATSGSMLLLRFELATVGNDTRVTLNAVSLTVGSNTDDARGSEPYDAAVKFLQSLAE